MTSEQQEVALWGISSLVPSEMVLDAQVKELARRIVESGIWTHPIPVCARSGLVMDGNHRLRAAKSLGLRRVPVIPLSYESQRVKVRNRRDGAPFERSRFDAVIRAAALLPYKTTLHEFEPTLPVTSIALDLLFAPADGA
jgi:ParB-like chromosome segregation protein Spo0J